MIAALLSCIFYRPPLVVVFILMVPMIADGLIQRLTAYESTNLKRVVTGTLFGYALVMLFILPAVPVLRFGIDLGRSLRA